MGPWNRWKLAAQVKRVWTTVLLLSHPPWIHSLVSRYPHQTRRHPRLYCYHDGSRRRRSPGHHRVLFILLRLSIAVLPQVSCSSGLPPTYGYRAVPPSLTLESHTCFQGVADQPAPACGEGLRQCTLRQSPAGCRYMYFPAPLTLCSLSYSAL
jgi:hypothetical protein